LGILLGDVVRFCPGEMGLHVCSLMRVVVSIIEIAMRGCLLSANLGLGTLFFSEFFLSLSDQSKKWGVLIGYNIHKGAHTQQTVAKDRERGVE